jgi:hypothetical protein
MLMKPWVRWTTGSALALIGTAICFLNFFAAADLGYDAYPGGKAIISRWGYAMLALFVAGAVCGVMALRTVWKSRKRAPY